MVHNGVPLCLQADNVLVNPFQGRQTRIANILLQQTQSDSSVANGVSNVLDTILTLILVGLQTESPEKRLF